MVTFRRYDARFFCGRGLIFSSPSASLLSSSSSDIKGGSGSAATDAGRTGKLMKRALAFNAFSSSTGWDHCGPGSLGHSGANRKHTARLSACKLQCRGMPVPPTMFKRPQQELCKHRKYSPYPNLQGQDSAGEIGSLKEGKGRSMYLLGGPMWTRSLHPDWPQLHAALGHPSRQEAQPLWVDH